ncbi:hypothetical protein PM8797T_20493 [Gimesia maris DSM 8797]|nr:hypothetical protein PM8797T_20493 [Gimesia maris DSM 8797]
MLHAGRLLSESCLDVWLFSILSGKSPSYYEKSDDLRQSPAVIHHPVNKLLQRQTASRLSPTIPNVQPQTQIMNILNYPSSPSNFGIQHGFGIHLGCDPHSR